MTEDTPNPLFQRIQAGERQALKELFEREYLPVCRTIRRFVSDPATVEDLAQEVFLRFWVKRESLAVKSSLPAYLRRMAVNEALAYLRRQRNHIQDDSFPRLAAPPSDDAEERLLQSELEHQLRMAIHELPPRCRTIFQLSRFEELSYKEIAQQLDISVKTVENQMGKALKHLRHRLAAYLHVFL